MSVERTHVCSCIKILLCGSAETQKHSATASATHGNPACVPWLVVAQMSLPFLHSKWPRKSTRDEVWFWWFGFGTGYENSIGSNVVHFSAKQLRQPYPPCTYWLMNLHDCMHCGWMSYVAVLRFNSTDLYHAIPRCSHGVDYLGSVSQCFKIVFLVYSLLFEICINHSWSLFVVVCAGARTVRSVRPSAMCKPWRPPSISTDGFTKCKFDWWRTIYDWWFINSRLR